MIKTHEIMNASIAEIKNNLHKLIVETNDEEILNKVHDFFQQLKDEDIDWWDIISEEEKEKVQDGLEQLNQGKSFSHDEVRAKVNQLFGNNEKE